MKKIIIYAFTFIVFAFGQTFAQSVAEQNLDNAIQSAGNIKAEVVIARKAVNQLVKQLTITGNPNLTLFADSMTNANDAKEANANDVDSYVSIAKSNSTIDFSTTQITLLTSQILEQNDVIYVLTNQIVAAVNSNNTTLALNLISPLRNALTKQVNRSNSIITKILEIKQIIKTYNVCIIVIDDQGNQTSYQPGFYAYNTVTGENLYPNDNQGNQNGGECFLNLPSGTYTFGGFQDYFCGVSSSSAITLSDSLLNEDGIIEVTLVRWCE